MRTGQLGFADVEFFELFAETAFVGLLKLDIGAIDAFLHLFECVLEAGVVISAIPVAWS